jgi:hypothetical protein
MSQAIEAKSAARRASIAARLIRTIKRHDEGGWGLGCCRGFDDCFEMGDGDDVYRILRAMVASDRALACHVIRHWPDSDGPCDLGTGDSPAIRFKKAALECLGESPTDEEKRIMGWGARLFCKHGPELSYPDGCTDETWCPWHAGWFAPTPKKEEVSP